jgi:D-alanyl-D-alanine carboxypeptidase (penicillin-binding protein 5/6)
LVPFPGGWGENLLVIGSEVMVRKFLQFFSSIRMRWIFLILFSVLFCGRLFAETAAPNLGVRAQSALVMDSRSGQILYEKNPNLKMAPASFAKILTLYLVFDALRAGDLKMDDQVTVSSKAWRTKGSRMFLKVGEKVKVEDLIKGVAVVSGNDASVALAEHLAGMEEAFVSKMNEKAKTIGLKDSWFKNSHGLPAEGQHTTAFDIATLARRYIEDHPESLRFHAIAQFEYQGIRQRNRNPLLDEGMGVDGLMTGYVEKAGYHLLATAKQGDRRIIALVMGCETSQKRGRETYALLEYGLKNFSTVEVFRKGDPFGTVKVVGGKQRKVEVVAGEEGVVTVAMGKERTISVSPEVTESIAAPIKKGQVAGRILIQSEEKVVKEVPLVTASDVIKGISFPWLLLAGALVSLILVSLFGYFVRRSHRRRFR